MKSRSMKRKDSWYVHEGSKRVIHCVEAELVSFFSLAFLYANCGTSAQQRERLGLGVAQTLVSSGAIVSAGHCHHSSPSQLSEFYVQLFSTNAWSGS